MRGRDVRLTQLGPDTEESCGITSWNKNVPLCDTDSGNAALRLNNKEDSCAAAGCATCVRAACDHHATFVTKPEEIRPAT